MNSYCNGQYWNTVTPVNFKSGLFRASSESQPLVRMHLIYWNSQSLTRDSLSSAALSLLDVQQDCLSPLWVHWCGLPDLISTPVSVLPEHVNTCDKNEILGRVQEYIKKKKQNKTYIYTSWILLKSFSFRVRYWKLSSWKRLCFKEGKTYYLRTLHAGRHQFFANCWSLSMLSPMFFLSTSYCSGFALISPS